MTGPSGSEPPEPPKPVESLGKRHGTWRPRDQDGYPPPEPGFCNAHITRKGEPARCRQQAGHRTDHPGYGSCLRHCGNTETGRKNGVREMYAAQLAGRTRFGEVLETDPMLGLLGEVNRTVGFIRHVQERIGDDVDPETGDPKLIDVGLGGARASALVKLWQEERAHLARICKMALDAGVAQQQLDLVTAYQERVLDLLEGVLRDCGLDPDAPAVSEAVTRRLALVSAHGVAS